MIGRRRLPEQAALNETYQHGGTATYAISVALAAAYGKDIWIFLIVVIMALVAMWQASQISPLMVDDDRARSLVRRKINTSLGASTAVSEAISYFLVVSNSRILIFALSVFLFHLSSAAMLPLLSQVFALNDSAKGLVISGITLAISQLVVMPTALLVGKKLQSREWNTTSLFLFAMIIVTIRGVIITLSMNAHSALSLLLGQVLHGVATGIYKVIAVVVTEELTRGSGRFSFVFGVITTAQVVGGAFSLLIAMTIADHKGFISAFIFLTAISVLPIIVFGMCMPAANISASDADDDDSMHAQSPMMSENNSPSSMNTSGEGNNNPMNSQMMMM